MADVKEIKYLSLEKLGYYDAKVKSRMEAADEAIREALQKNIDAANTAIEAEATRAKAQEATNAAAAEAAQNAAEAAQKDVDDLEKLVGTPVEGKTVVGMIEDVIADAYNDTEVRNLIAGLQSSKADKTQVATDIAAAVKVEEDARKEAVAGVQGEVDALEKVHADDKAELEGKIGAKADQTALDAVSDVANAAVKQADYDVKVKALEDEDARIVGLVEAEKARAEGVEADHEERLVEVETFFKTAEGETLDTALDTLVEIQKYLDGEGEVADQMLLDIAANKKAIEDHVATDHDFGAADEALKSELNAEIAKKADASTVSDMDAAYKAADSALSGRIDALEAIDHEHANKAVIDGITAEKVAAWDVAEANAKSHADGLNTAMNTRVEALEAIDHDHANKAELDLIASGDKAKWDAAEAKAHEHANKAELDKVAEGDVAKWNAAEQNAKDFATGLNNAMDGRMGAVETSLATGGATANAIAEAKKAGTDAQAEVDALELVVATKAAQDDLTALANRVGAEETKSTNFESRIAELESFTHTEITNAEIDAIFATV